MYSFSTSDVHNNLTPDFSDSESGVNIPSGSGNSYAYPVDVTPGTTQHFHVENTDDKNGQWHITAPGWYKLEVDLLDNSIKFTPIPDVESHS